MPCSSAEALARLFYNASTAFQLLLIFSYIASIFLAKFFYFLGGNPFLQRNQDRYEFGEFSDHEEEEEEEEEGNVYYNVKRSEKDDHLVANIICGRKGIVYNEILDGEIVNNHEGLRTEEEDEDSGDNFSSVCSSPAQEVQSGCGDFVGEEINGGIESDPDYDSDTNDGEPNSPMAMNMNRSGFVTGDETHDGKWGTEECENGKMGTRDEKFLIFGHQTENNKKFEGQEKNKNIVNEEEIYGDSCTVGSTSKSSSEWRSSIFNRDSGTDDPFSSSSRRSCPKWESYTVFQKYDEEMMFLDRISAQKLHETESLRSIQACPRSISERIVHKLATVNKKSSDFRVNPYHELEAAYVAQICLAWEALNWNYKYFQRLRAARRQLDPGCPAYVAQQFQQFQVLLQRYVENEPYEKGRRPEIYARMRSLAPKLLQVPEYRDSDEKKEVVGSRIPSQSFVIIMEESIRTFMNFLKADRENNHCQILTSFFRRNRKKLVDPTRFLLLKKINKKKKLKLKDLRRAGKCLRNKRRLKKEEEMEILMALIDMKVVSRVMRMTDLSEHQLSWCEDKMNKVRVSDKLHRDSSPLFFPAH